MQHLVTCNSALFSCLIMTMPDLASYLVMPTGSAALQAAAATATPGQPLYHKGSGLASLAKFLANAQRLHGVGAPQNLLNKGAQASNQTPTTAAEVAAEGSRPGSAQK